MLIPCDFSFNLFSDDQKYFNVEGSIKKVLKKVNLYKLRKWRFRLM